MKSPDKIYWKGLLGLAGLKILINIFLINKDYGFHRDEFLYLALGNHLDFGYWSNPPFIGLVGFLSQNLFGDSLLAVRLFPILAGGLLVLFTGLIAHALSGGLYAQLFAAFAILCSPSYLRAFSMLQPVPFDILFWTIALYFLIKYLKAPDSKWLFWLAGTVAIGTLNKYTLAFFIFGLIIALLLSSHRKLFLQKSTWSAVGIALLIIFPNILWQYKYNFPVLSHMEELASSQLSNVAPIAFLIDQLWMQFTGALIWLPGLVYLLFGRKMASFRIVGYFYLAVLFIFLGLNGKSYYTLGMYPTLFAAGAVFIEKELPKLWVKILAPLILIAGILISLPLGAPLFKPQKQVEFYQQMEADFGVDVGRRWEDGEIHPLPQDFADMLGWQELTNLVVTAYGQAENPKKCLIYCSNYGQAGAVDFLNETPGLPAVVSFADSYRFWAPAKIPDFESIIYVNDELGEDVAKLFDSINLIGTVEHQYAREQGTKVYLCENPNSNFPAFWESRYQLVQATFTRSKN